MGGELTIARRFFANMTDAERDLIAYWQMVKLVEEAHLRYASEREAWRPPRSEEPQSRPMAGSGG